MIRAAARQMPTYSQGRKAKNRKNPAPLLASKYFILVFKYYILLLMFIIIAVIDTNIIMATASIHLVLLMLSRVVVCLLF